MNELSCRKDAEAIAQTLWQQVISIGWIESVQNSIDELYQDMLRDNLKSGMYGLDDLFFDLIEYNDEHIREAIEFEFNNLDSYEEERKTIHDEEEYIDLDDLEEIEEERQPQEKSKGKPIQERKRKNNGQQQFSL